MRFHHITFENISYSGLCVTEKTYKIHMKGMLKCNFQRLKSLKSKLETLLKSISLDRSDMLNYF